MRILFDTNIFIYREDNYVIPKDVQDLLKVLSSSNVIILLHPYIIDEIKRDSNEQRKKVILSKINTYQFLNEPPDYNIDPNFVNIIGETINSHNIVDNSLLFSIYKNAVDFLITEDKGIHKKAGRLNIKDRVLYIKEALELFERTFYHVNYIQTPPLKEEDIYKLDINDPFFDSLKSDYKEFEQWFVKISKEGRRCWVYYNNDSTIGALLIYKIENEIINSIPQIPSKKRLKISTLKVMHRGYKVGELFLKISIGYAIDNGMEEIYLTHFTKENDELIDLITEYGFQKIAKNSRDEDIFIKKLIIEDNKVKDLSPLEIAKIYYPSFYDGNKVNKFIIPIQPEYHKRLFTDYNKRQLTLSEYIGNFIVEGNTIKKAYLCHSKIRNISKGDILLFYRSKDGLGLTSLGIVENVFSGIFNKDDIIRYVGKRTVYSVDEIDQISKKSTLVLLFNWNFHFKKSINLKLLKELSILTGSPQSITGINHEKYLIIKKAGEIDERFTID